MRVEFSCMLRIYFWPLLPPPLGLKCYFLGEGGIKRAMNQFLATPFGWNMYYIYIYGIISRVSLYTRAISFRFPQSSPLAISNPISSATLRVVWICAFKRQAQTLAFQMYSRFWSLTESVGHCASRLRFVGRILPRTTIDQK